MTGAALPLGAGLRDLAVLPALTNGIAAGIMLATVIGVVPLMVAHTYPRYVRTVQFLWPRYDPTMPILNGVSLVLAVVMAVVQPAPARPFYVLAALLLAVVMTISITRNVPVNRYVSGLDPEREPADWATADPRPRWRRWNTIRTTVAITAFLANVLAVLAVSGS